jgi:hypothetical protein
LIEIRLRCVTYKCIADSSEPERCLKIGNELGAGNMNSNCVTGASTAEVKLLSVV